MRLWVSCLLLILLGGCLSSETPKIPVAELSRPRGFNGQFWYLSLRHDSGLMTYLVGITAQPDRTFTQTRGDAERFRLVRLISDDVYLFISDAKPGESNDDKLSTYYLLQQHPGGAWELDDVSINYAGPFAEQNAVYLQDVVARHGLTLGSPEERTRIIGPVHGLVIPQLFRDPAFLGALLVTPEGGYLPARSGLKAADAASFAESGRVDFELELARTPMLAQSVLAKPDGFAGHYIQSAGKFGSTSTASVDARPDGRFDLRVGETVHTISLLPFDKDRQTFVGIRDWDFMSGGEPEHHAGLIMVARTDDGWSLTSIVLRPSAGSGALDSLLGKLVEQSLQRHGLEIKDGKISGALDAEDLVNLLHDGQFTSCLAMDDEPITLLAAEH